MALGKSIPLPLDFPEAGPPATNRMTEVEDGVQLASTERRGRVARPALSPAHFTPTGTRP